jgi:small GTP-binding protein
MAPMYYRGAKAAICVFDVTNEDSLNRVSTWLRDLKSHADPLCVICIAGNKCDKEGHFDLTKVDTLAKQHGAVFFRTSALTGEGVNEIFESLANNVSEVYRNSRAASKDINNLKLNPSASTSNASSSTSVCC